MTLQNNSISNRIEVIDVLRGFALFGIVLIHMMEQYYAGPSPEGVGASAGIADGIAQGFGFIFIMGKFFIIFSFLFGLSFYIQFSKSNSEGNFLIRFSWRLIILLVIGMIHHLHYRGDILSIYALLGFALLLFYRLPDKALLIVAVLLILNLPAIITRSVQIFFPPENELINQDNETLVAYYETVKTGSYVEILKANLESFKTKMLFQVWSGRLYITLGLFLLGIYAGRKNFFTNIQDKLPQIKKLIRYSLWTLLACILLAAAVFGGAQLMKIEMSQQLMFLIGGFIMDVFNAALSVVYISWILLLFQNEKWHKRLMLLYPVGRMGLTTYLTQTLFGTMIFFSYGLGLIYELGAFYSLMLGIAIFVIQIIFANVWFRYFAYGPVEWLWRNLTYFKLQAITLEKARA